MTAKTRRHPRVRLRHGFAVWLLASHLGCQRTRTTSGHEPTLATPPDNPADTRSAAAGKMERGDGGTQPGAKLGMPAAEKGPPASTTKGAGAGGKIPCGVSWSATQWLNIGPLGLTTEYPPWIVPMIAAEPGGGLFVGFNARTTDLARDIKAASLSAIVSKLGADCEPRWVRPLVQSSALQITSVQSDSQANLVLAGWFSGTLDFGDGAVAESTNGRGFFISKLDADGSHLWTRVHEIGENIAELRIGPDDRMIVSGTAVEGADFGMGPIARGRSNFLALFDASGEFLWGASDPESYGRDLAILDASGNVLRSRGNPPSDPEERSLLEKRDAAGTPLWSLDIASAFDLTIRTQSTRKDRLLAATAESNILHLEPYVPQALQDADPDDRAWYGSWFEFHPSSLSFITAGGAPGWTRGVADFGGARAGALTTDASGNPIIAGDFTGTVEFATAKLMADGPRDVFVSEFDQDGNERWTVRAGGEGSDWAGELASSPSGDIWLSGWSGKLEPSSLDSIYDSLHRERVFILKLVP